jgi:hypothetical protein
VLSPVSAAAALPPHAALCGTAPPPLPKVPPYPSCHLFGARALRWRGPLTAAPGQRYRPRPPSAARPTLRPPRAAPHLGCRPLTSAGIALAPTRQPPSQLIHCHPAVAATSSTTSSAAIPPPPPPHCCTPRRPPPLPHTSTPRCPPCCPRPSHLRTPQRVAPRRRPVVPQRGGPPPRVIRCHPAGAATSSPASPAAISPPLPPHCCTPRRPPPSPHTSTPRCPPCRPRPSRLCTLRCVAPYRRRVVSQRGGLSPRHPLPPCRRRHVVHRLVCRHPAAPTAPLLHAAPSSTLAVHDYPALSPVLSTAVPPPHAASCGTAPSPRRPPARRSPSPRHPLPPCRCHHVVPRLVRRHPAAHAAPLLHAAPSSAVSFPRRSGGGGRHLRRHPCALYIRRFTKTRFVSFGFFVKHTARWNYKLLSTSW